MAKFNVTLAVGVGGDCGTWRSVTTNVDVPSIDRDDLREEDGDLIFSAATDKVTHVLNTEHIPYTFVTGLHWIPDDLEERS